MSALPTKSNRPATAAATRLPLLGLLLVQLLVGYEWFIS